MDKTERQLLYTTSSYVKQANIVPYNF